jgi:hypothetical protein
VNISRRRGYISHIAHPLYQNFQQVKMDLINFGEMSIIREYDPSIEREMFSVITRIYHAFGEKNE